MNKTEFTQEHQSVVGDFLVDFPNECDFMLDKTLGKIVCRLDCGVILRTDYHDCVHLPLTMVNSLTALIEELEKARDKITCYTVKQVATKIEK